MPKVSALLLHPRAAAIICSPERNSAICSPSLTGPERVRPAPVPAEGGGAQVSFGVRSVAGVRIEDDSGIFRRFPVFLAPARRPGPERVRPAPVPAEGRRGAEFLRGSVGRWGEDRGRQRDFPSVPHFPCTRAPPQQNVAANEIQLFVRHPLPAPKGSVPLLFLRRGGGARVSFGVRSVAGVRIGDDSGIFRRFPVLIAPARRPGPERVVPQFRRVQPSTVYLPPVKIPIPTTIPTPSG
jgi:hypothetical protein